jgi:putative membrane protein
MYIIKSDLNKLIEVCGACERIRSTPIPFSYSAFLKKFIFFYVMLFPLIYAIHMSYFIIPVTVFILYVLSSIELIAEEIENPFDDAPNDLPTFKMAKNISVNVKMILDK